MKKAILIVFLVGILLAACGKTEEKPETQEEQAETITEEQVDAFPSGMRMGPGSGMMERHHAPIPDEYEGKTNLVSQDDQSLARGEEIYAANCATCHGDGGMGDGPGGETLDPAPAPIAHTSQMMGDDYLFYRISEGGAFEPFNSTMPSWKSSLDEKARWDVINYVRALGSGQVVPGSQMGGMMFDPEAESLKHQEMAAQGVEQGLFSQEDADTFVAVHEELDALSSGGAGQMGSMADRQAAMLEELVANGVITQEEADIFNEVHNKLLAAGLMQ